MLFTLASQSWTTWSGLYGCYDNAVDLGARCHAPLEHACNAADASSLNALAHVCRPHLVNGSVRSGVSSRALHPVAHPTKVCSPDYFRMFRLRCTPPSFSAWHMVVENNEGRAYQQVTSVPQQKKTLMI